MCPRIGRFSLLLKMLSEHSTSHLHTKSAHKRDSSYRYLSYQHHIVLGLEKVYHLIYTVTDKLA
ncbi:hypothetical protein BGY98DRAFT_980971 [Russula aff. rugulosa BPL654]|nr:hypothetical protein BGY98DRAFT_980971 [Russula aff. rugulosa BPL654]